METTIVIDCTPIPEKYDKKAIDEICCWAVLELHERQEKKWYNKLGINPFKHDYLKDYRILEKVMEE